MRPASACCPAAAESREEKRKERSHEHEAFIGWAQSEWAQSELLPAWVVRAKLFDCDLAYQRRPYHSLGV